MSSPPVISTAFQCSDPHNLSTEIYVGRMFDSGSAALLTSDPPATQANALKDLGNKAFSAKDYDKAIDLFSQAIAIDPKNHVLYSNRSAAKAGKKEWDAALADAEEVHLLFTF